MANLVKEVRLILADVDQNSNKYWTGQLFDNGDARTLWGRVGVTEDSKDFPGAGEKFLERKVKSKLKKGYTELRTVAGSGVESKTVTDIKMVARQQIQTKDTSLQALIDRLVDANIHQITSSTSIKYDTSTGLFSTPLGIVDSAAIIEARDLLVKIFDSIKKDDYTNKKFVQNVNSYLRLIPRNVGMKLNIRNIFPNADCLKKENDLLDSLEASYKALATQPTTGPNPITEKVFDVTLDILEDKTEWGRLVKKYQETLNRQHDCYHLKLKQIYRIDVKQNTEVFEKTAPQLGNTMELFHGSKISNLLSILKSGLIIPPASAAHVCGSLFGRGIYASIQSSKAANYSYGYWSGERHANCFLFIVQFALGKVYTPTGQGSWYRGGETFPKAGYDSTWAKAGTSGVMNDELIVYSTNQAKLTHLIELSE